MAAQLPPSIDRAVPVIHWIVRIYATGIAALTLVGCATDETDQHPPENETALGVAVADFDGDGQPDVAIPLSYGGDPPGAVGVYQHLSIPGKGYQARVDYPVGGDPYTILAFDLNRDNAPDLLTSDHRTQVLGVLWNSAIDPGTFGAVQSLPAHAVQVAVADMNGDGFPDLVAAGAPLLLFLQDFSAPGTFASPTTLFTNPSGVHFRSLAFSDLNGDGSPDIAASDDDDVRVLFTTPSTDPPTIASTTIVHTNVRPGEFSVVAVTDVDGDRRDDLVIADPGGPSVAVMRQSGAVPGEFLPATTFPLPAGAGLSVVVAELNGDGYPDIVSGGAAIVAVLLQDATSPGTFPEAISYGAPISASAVVVADIDGDGLPDIVTNSGITSTLEGEIVRTLPGVFYQDPSNAGSFLALQDLGAACVEPPAGLVSWWPGDGNTADIVGGRTAQLHAGATFGPGLVKGAFLLRGDEDSDGIGDFVSVPDGPGLNFGTQDFTIDLWALFNDPGTGEQVLLEKYIQRFQGQPSEGWTFTKLAGNELVLHTERDGVVQSSVSSPVPIQARTWVHLTATRQAGVISLYVNGERVSSDSWPGGNLNADSTSSVKFGHRGNPSDTPGSEDTRGFFLGGGIDEVEIFVGRALTEAEIRSIYRAGGHGKCKGPGS